MRLWAGYDFWSFGSNLMVCCRSRSPPAGGAGGAASCQDSRGRSVRRRRVVLLHSLGVAPEGGGGAQGHCDLLLSAGRCSGRRSARGEDDGSVWSSRSWENTAVVRHPHTHTHWSLPVHMVSFSQLNPNLLEYSAGNCSFCLLQLQQ